MAMSGNFMDVKAAVSSALVGTTRVAGQISNEDLAFHRASNPSIVPLLEKQNARLLELARGLTKTATTGTEVPAPHIKNAESVDDNWRSIVEVFDNLLEKTDACLDEFTGSIKRLSPGQEEQIKKGTPVSGKQKPGKAYRNHNIPKPQMLFNKVPKNDEKTAFKPLLQTKPHAIISLEASLGPVDSDDATKLYDTRFHISCNDFNLHLKDLINAQTRYRNPYETEIKASRYPPATFLKSDPTPYLSFQDTKATLVDTPEAVAAMLAELKQAREIAIDLEHHDEHSYIGLVSLMQISTREKDWIVDTLKPWRQDLQLLNEVFADPNILKVLHGAFMDTIWLQRDLGLYLVGLFDTFHASRALGYPRNSLAYLLKQFANFDAAKQYQMADWRIRPLPEEMFDYARSDTHFLLYIYDNMRNELIEKSEMQQSGENLIETVMQNSKEEALQRYERPFYDTQRGSGPMGWYNMLCRTPALFSREKFAVFRAVHQWRDNVARQEDESVHLVMPKHVLYNIARETPMDMPSLLGCSHPMSRPFQKRKEDLLGVIKQAKIKGANGPEMMDLMLEIDPMLGQKVRTTGSARPSEEVRAGPQSSKAVERPENALPLRSNSSRFWGPFMSDMTPADLTTKAQNLCLALPLPQLTAEVFEEAGSSQVAKEGVQSHPGAQAEHQYIRDRPSKKDDIFIVKHDGGSRKRKATTYPQDTEQSLPQKDGATLNGGEEMEISLDQDSEAERKRAKAERKAEKKRLKQEQKQQANGAPKDGDEDAAEAFDYANAPSVLHAKQSKEERRATASKGVNPYAKSMDAPQGMRRTHKEIAGKSQTFKQ